MLFAMRHAMQMMLQVISVMAFDVTDRASCSVEVIVRC